MFVIGLDPGADGAITAMDKKGNILFSHPFRLSKSEEFTPELIVKALPSRKFLKSHKDHPIAAYIEQVHAMTGQGVSSMFNFGKAYGWLEMALIMRGFDVVRIHPSVWTRSIHRSKAQTPKARSLETALKLWPDFSFVPTLKHRTPHSGMVDSALICEFGRQELITLGI